MSSPVYPREGGHYIITTRKFKKKTFFAPMKISRPSGSVIKKTFCRRRKVFVVRHAPHAKKPIPHNTPSGDRSGGLNPPPPWLPWGGPWGSLNGHQGPFLASICGFENPPKGVLRRKSGWMVFHGRQKNGFRYRKKWFLDVMENV